LTGRSHSHSRSQASRQIVEEDETGDITFYVDPLVDFAGNTAAEVGRCRLTLRNPR